MTHQSILDWWTVTHHSIPPLSCLSDHAFFFWKSIFNLSMDILVDHQEWLCDFLLLPRSAQSVCVGSLLSSWPRATNLCCTSRESRNRHKCRHVTIYLTAWYFTDLPCQPVHACHFTSMWPLFRHPPFLSHLCLYGWDHQPTPLLVSSAGLLSLLVKPLTSLSSSLHSSFLLVEHSTGQYSCQPTLCTSSLDGILLHLHLVALPVDLHTK